MDEHLETMYAIHAAEQREERLVTRAGWLLVAVFVLAVTLAAVGGWL
jgi:hypothetical protein